jgi:protein arginine kinase
MRKLLLHRRRAPAPVLPQDEIALSCRIRLARNLDGVRFPDWNDETGHFSVVETIVKAVRQAGGLQGLTVIGDRNNPAGQQVLAALQEQHVVSKDLLDRGAGGALIQCEDPGVSIMLNEEDHLRIQVIRSGMDLASVWAVADQLDSRLESNLDYAFSTKLGYLTACPSNVGTGLRASVMVHLLGLRLTEDLEAVLRALNGLRLMVRGVDGEGTDAAGHLFQISNQGTLGQSEHQVIETLLQQVNEVIRQEHFARLRLLRDAPVMLHDCIARALALLQNARMIPADEAMDYLSALRLGVQLKLLQRLRVAQVDELMLNIQPVHLQRLLNLRESDPDERDARRADWLRRELAAVVLTP